MIRMLPRCLLLVMSMMVPSAPAAVPIVVDGRPAAVVVTADRPTAVARYAAEELVCHVEKATGVRLSIVGESSAGSAPACRIYVGDCQTARRMGISADKLSPEAFRLKIVQSALYVVGADGPGDPLSLDTRAGTLWGVYQWLERALGVRWLWPGERGIYVPKARTLTATETDETIAPRFLQRKLRSGLDFELKYPALGFTAEGAKQYARDQQVFLRRHRMGRSRRLSYGHAFVNWWEKYGRDHPDWFQLLENGRRGPKKVGARFSMCVSNPGLQEQILKPWRAAKARYPDAAIAINACENDILGLCTCEACRAWDGAAPEGAEEFYANSSKMAGARFVSDRYARFWLSLQQKAAQEDPQATVIGYAYMNYFPAPTSGIELNSHILVGLCPSGGWFPRSPEEHAWLKAQWTEWSKTGARLFERSNHFLDGYAMPHVFAHQFADEFRHALHCGMVATDFDSLTGQWATQGTNLYLLVRLHAHPERSADDLLAEYYSAFGPAAGQVKEYFDYWEKYAIERRAEMVRLFAVRHISRYREFAKVAHELFPAAAFAPAEAILTKAAEAARADGEAAARVEFLRTGLRHASLCARAAAEIALGTPSAATARDELIAFRRAHERDGTANFNAAAWVEGMSWDLPPGP